MAAGEGIGFGGSGSYGVCFFGLHTLEYVISRTPPIYDKNCVRVKLADLSATVTDSVTKLTDAQISQMRHIYTSSQRFCRS